jgi:hypothetical protein
LKRWWEQEPAAASKNDRLAAVFYRLAPHGASALLNGRDPQWTVIENGRD